MEPIRFSTDKNNAIEVSTRVGNRTGATYVVIRKIWEGRDGVWRESADAPAWWLKPEHAEQLGKVLTSPMVPQFVPTADEDEIPF